MDFLLLVLTMAHHHAESAAAMRDEAVSACRREGMSWDAIGAAVGMSKANAYKRFRHLNEPGEIGAALRRDHRHPNG